MSQLKMNLEVAEPTTIDVIQRRLNTFKRPANYNLNAWEVLKRNALKIWEAHLRGESWADPVSITCRESYLMLVDEQGQLIIRDESLLEWISNRHTSAWANKLESIALEAARQGNYAKAIRYFSKVLKIRSNSYYVRYQRALVLERIGDLKAALRDLNAAIAIEPRIDELFLKRASIHAELGQTQHAYYDLNAAIRLDPKDPRPYLQRSLLKKANGDLPGGKEDLKIAMKLQKPFSNAKYLNLIDNSSKTSYQAA